MLFNFAQLSWAMRKRLGRFAGRALASTALKTGLASAGMAVIVRGGVLAAAPWWRESFMGAAVVVAGGLLVGVVVTWGMYRALRVAELADLEAALGGLGRRLGIRRGR
jgi:hypothetical protein